MVIAINIKREGENELNKNDNFIFETFERIIRKHPEHSFIIISEQAVTNFFSSSDNVINAVIGHQGRFPIEWYIWYNRKISKILKKYKADIFISYGLGSSTTKIPQCIILSELDFVYQSKKFKKSHLLFYKTYLPLVLKKSKFIITVSQFCKTDIQKHLKINGDKIGVVYKGTNENYKEINYDERGKIKTTYAGGNEFFLCAGEIGQDKNLLNFLKAFSAFKKRQKSNMQLLFAGKEGWKYDEVIESLRLFKFKEDVKVLNNISSEELINITASAYGFVYPSFFEGFPTEIIEAMNSGVPVIASSTGAIHEICGDAALYAVPENFKEIAVCMMSLFRDENLRKILIEKGKSQAEKFSWDNTSDLLWNRIQELITH